MAIVRYLILEVLAADFFGLYEVVRGLIMDLNSYVFTIEAGLSLPSDIKIPVFVSFFLPNNFFAINLPNLIVFT